MILAITGTSKGIGKALAEHFCGRGDRVYGCGRSPATIEHPGYAHSVVDLTRADEVKAFFRDIRRQHGQLDGLINNAGTAVMNHFMLMPETANRAIFDLNVHALLACSREAAPLLSASAHPAPSIVNFSTVAVPWSLEGQAAYSASKSAVEQLTRVLSRELAGNRVRVNALGLPVVRTALSRTVPKEKLDRVIARQTIARQCEMSDVVGPVEFLLSEQARFVTGEVLYLGGVN
jgi:3-oxoacyl-[acyl-carrier protein] reductase